MQKKVIFLALIFQSIFCFAQKPKQWQISLGWGQTFVTQNHMTSGTLELWHVPSRTWIADVSKNMKWLPPSWTAGIQGKVSMVPLFPAIRESLPYFKTEDGLVPQDFESAEVYTYLRKQWNLKTKNADFFVRPILQAGLCFTITDIDGKWTSYALKNGNYPYFILQETDFRTVKPWFPYPRLQGGLDVGWKRKKFSFGFSPFISVVALVREKNQFVTVPNDPMFRSTGYFKYNRNGYGIRVFLSK